MVPPNMQRFPFVAKRLETTKDSGYQVMFSDIQKNRLGIEITEKVHYHYRFSLQIYQQTTKVKVTFVFLSIVGSISTVGHFAESGQTGQHCEKLKVKFEIFSTGQKQSSKFDIVLVLDSFCVFFLKKRKCCHLEKWEAVEVTRNIARTPRISGNSTAFFLEMNRLPVLNLIRMHFNYKYSSRLNLTSLRY